jgi:hypothetical protein
MTNYAVTTNSNTAVGNAAISDTFSAKIFYANTSLNVGNSTVNTIITSENSVQISNGQYFLNANGSWVFNTSAPIVNGAIETTAISQQEIDSYSIDSINASEYYVHIKDNNANAFHSSKILTLHDTGAAYFTEYATVTSNGSLGTFVTSCNGTHVSLLMTPTSSNTTVTFTRVDF